MSVRKGFCLVGLLLCLISVSANARTKYVSGVGRFHAKDEDSVSFVKKQLLYEAFRDVVTKELKSMGHDPEAFWSRSDEEFAEYFEPIEQNLRARFKMEREKVPAKVKKQFNKTLRLKRLNLRRKFQSITKVIPSYSISKVSRSTKYPNSRFLRIQAKINRKKLNQLYIETTRNSDSREFPYIFISASFDLTGGDWTDFGIEAKSDFTDPIVAHWQKWLGSNLNNYVGEVVVLTKENEHKIREIVKSSSSLEGEFELSEGKSVALAKIKQSLLLNVGIQMKKLSWNDLIGVKKYRLKGRVLAIDMNNGQPLFHQDISSEDVSLEVQDQSAFISNLASIIYGKPIVGFRSWPKKISALLSGAQEVNIELSSPKSFNDVSEFQDLLSSKGLPYQLKLSIAEYNTQGVRFVARFNGEKASLQTLLQSLEQHKLGPNRSISIDHDNPLKFGIIYNVESTVKKSSADTNGVTQ